MHPDLLIRSCLSGAARKATGVCPDPMAAGGQDEGRPERGVDPVTGVIREGAAEVLPNNQNKRKDGKDDVFYNPAQVFNRDMSVLVLSVFGKIQQADMDEGRLKKGRRAKETGKPVRESPPPGLKVLEALAATGIRSIRYAKELEGSTGVRKIVANDLDPTAVEHIRRNVEHNGVPPGRIEVSNEDACGHMYARRARNAGGVGDDAYDVIDLDPYGTVSPFLDAAVQAIADGGLLCITSTDMPILGGNNSETCFARYGGAAIKSSYVHEMALRLVLHATSSAAAKYGREVRPLLSVSIDFYVRIFVRVFDSPARAKYQASKTGLVHQCVQCESFFVQPLGDTEGEASAPKFKAARVVTPGSDCPECGNRMKLAGPFYIGPMYDQSFVTSCLEACETGAAGDLPGITSWKKIKGLLTAISQEHVDLVLYYRLPQLCKGLKLEPVPLRQFRGTLAALGHRVSHFHREPEAIKTDAPNAVIYDLMRLWAEEHPPKKQEVLEKILKKELTLKRPIKWVTEEEVSRKDKVPRFLPNPAPNWGPRARAKGGAVPDDAKAAAVTPVLALAAPVEAALDTAEAKVAVATPSKASAEDTAVTGGVAQPLD